MGSPRKLRRSPLLRLEPLEAREVPAAGLFADLNRVGADAFPADRYFAGSPAAVAGGSAYFFATDGTHPLGLFKSDGTAAGTVLVKALSPAPRSGLPGGAMPVPEGYPPQAVVAAGGTVYFPWDDGEHGAELWASDGTAAGTKLAVDIKPGPDGSGPVLVGAAGGRLLFTASSAVDTGLYSTDGTAGGTVKLFSSTEVGLPVWWAVAGGTTYFFREGSGRSAGSVWTSDGTPGGTTQLAALPAGVGFAGMYYSGPPTVAVVGKTVYFGAADAAGQELWAADAAGARRVADVNPTPGAGSNPRNLVTVGSAVYFVADDGTHGDQLWVSTGTAAGTRMVKDLGSPGGTVSMYPGPNGAKVNQLTAVNGKVYFTAADGANGRQVYVSDGTAAGTVRLTAAVHSTPGDPASFLEEPAILSAVGGRVVFTIGDKTAGRQLWATDGTAAGTTALRAFAGSTPPGWPAAVGPGGVAAVGGKYLFVADDGTTGRQLWATDGTAAGTAPVAAVNPLDRPSDPSGFLAAGGKAYFVADDGRGAGVFVTDGTAAPTLVKRFGGTYAGPSAIAGTFTETPALLTASGGGVYFVVRAGWYGRELWKTDGTPAGTVRLKELPATAYAGIYEGVGGGIDNLTDAGGTLYFTVDVPGGGQSLWKTDGTAAGTKLVKQVNAVAATDNQFGFESGHMGGTLSPRGLTAAGGAVYFVADDGTHGAELWVSDGTAAGTRLVTDLNTAAPWLGGGTLGSNPADLTAFSGKLYFTAASTGGDRELWATDGTAAGTARVTTFFGWPDGPGVWVYGRSMAAANGKLYIAAAGRAWVSDGTAAGTVAVTPTSSLGPDAYPAAVPQFTAAGGKVFFVAYTFTDGRQVYVSDGTAAGTRVPLTVGGVRTVWSEWGQFQMDADPAILTAAGGRVLFTANNYSGGRELWVTDGTAAGTKRVAEMAPGTAGGLPAVPSAPYGPAASAVVVGNKLLLAGTDATHGAELWAVPAADFLPAAPPPPPTPAPTPTPTPAPAPGKAALVKTFAPSGAEGLAFAADLAVVRLPAGPAYKVWVFWGDGRTAEATLTPTGKAAGEFTLSAWHTYAAPGTFAVMIRVTADTKTVLSIDTKVTVADAKWYAGRVAARVTAGQPFAGVVATVQDLNPAGGKATDYTATIDWGDGRTTAGVVRKTADGRFAVDGVTTFAAAGKRTVTVTIRSVATGATATAASVFTIDPAKVTLAR